MEKIHVDELRCDLCDHLAREGAGHVTSDAVLCDDCLGKIMRDMIEMEMSYESHNEREVLVSGYYMSYKE